MSKYILFDAGNRHINLIVVHCSATPPSMDIGVRVIDKWHRENGWEGCGYHFVVRRNGLVESGRDLMKIGAHAKGNNHNSIGLCLIGGVDNYHQPENNYTKAQMDTLKFMLEKLSEQFAGIAIVGHHDLQGAHKDCPCFDVKAFCMENSINAGKYEGKG
jgi:N-acetylmuramoyl-L-alanine amidase